MASINNGVISISAPHGSKWCLDNSRPFLRISDEEAFIKSIKDGRLCISDKHSQMLERNPPLKRILNVLCVLLNDQKHTYPTLINFMKNMFDSNFKHHEYPKIYCILCRFYAGIVDNANSPEHAKIDNSLNCFDLRLKAQMNHYKKNKMWSTIDTHCICEDNFGCMIFAANTIEKMFLDTNSSSKVGIYVCFDNLLKYNNLYSIYNDNDSKLFQTLFYRFIGFMLMKAIHSINQKNDKKMDSIILQILKSTIVLKNQKNMSHFFTKGEFTFHLLLCDYFCLNRMFEPNTDRWMKYLSTYYLALVTNDKENLFRKHRGISIIVNMLLFQFVHGNWEEVEFHFTVLDILQNKLFIHHNAVAINELKDNVQGWKQKSNKERFDFIQKDRKRYETYFSNDLLFSQTNFITLKNIVGIKQCTGIYAKKKM